MSARMTSATKQNEHGSSRSHLVLTMRLQHSSTGRPDSSTQSFTLQMVDLAGTSDLMVVSTCFDAVVTHAAAVAVPMILWLACFSSHAACVLQRHELAGKHDP